MRPSSRPKIIYDGHCGFCRSSVEQLKAIDIFKALDFEPGPQGMAEMKLIDGQKEYGGFYAFRQLCWRLPVLYPWLVLVYLPFAGKIGSWIYKIIAKNRYLFPVKHTCSGGECRLK